MHAPATRHALELTTEEVAELLGRNPLVILPAGSVEQHGPHLPTGTDYFAALAIGEAVAERLDGLLLPSCPIGVTPLHMPFPGTLTLRPDTYLRVIEDIAASVAAHGARRMLLLNWHEGNIPVLALAAEGLHRSLGLSVVTVQACYVAEEMFGPVAGGLTHGGEIEAWAVLARHPELVHLDRVRGSSDRRRGELVDRLRRTRSFQPVLTDVRTIAPTGWYGEPQRATPEKAREFISRLADEIARQAGEIFKALEALQPEAGRGG